jgi:hypothetical protein
MSPGIVIPTSTLQTAPKTLIGLGLDNGNASIGLAGRPLSFDIALRIITTKLKREAAFVEPHGLRYRCACEQKED